MVKLKPDEVLVRLIEGNRRFIEGNFAEKYLVSKRQELASGQNPIAMIIACADSRVSPEYVFDQGLGDLFVIRVAGNLVGPLEIASAEYAVSFLGIPLILVLGHEDCGAVRYSFNATDESPYISRLVREIKPSIILASKKSSNFEETLYCAIVENVKRTALKLVKKSKIVMAKINSGDLRVMTGIYRMATGKVEFLNNVVI